MRIKGTILGYIGIMEKKVETSIGGYIGIVWDYRDCIGLSKPGGLLPCDLWSKLIEVGCRGAYIRQYYMGD